MSLPDLEDQLPERKGLLDSGATHAMRGLREGEDAGDLESIQVELATGQKMAKGRSSFTRTRRSMGSCPALGDIPVLDARRGSWCCVLSTCLSRRRFGARVRSIKHEAMALSGLAENETVFWGVPDEVMDKVIETPADNLKGVKQEEDAGEAVRTSPVRGREALQRALKEAGGDATRLVEVDLNRRSWEWLAALIAGREGLRQYLLPTGKPRPVSSDFRGLMKKGKKHVWEDDVLLYRMIMIYCVAETARRRRRGQGWPFCWQPEAPDYVPECGSWWRMAEWR